MGPKRAFACCSTCMCLNQNAHASVARLGNISESPRAAARGILSYRLKLLRLQLRCCSHVQRQLPTSQVVSALAHPLTLVTLPQAQVVNACTEHRLEMHVLTWVCHVCHQHVRQIQCRCPECAPGSIDLAAQGNGRWNVQWVPIPCNVGKSTFFYHTVSDLGNPYYYSFSVSNTR